MEWLRTRVKFCGITNPADALAAVEAGADAIGMVFVAGSPRHLRVEQAREIASHIPPLVGRVGLFVNPTRDLVLDAVEACGLDALQFHGEESPEFCQQFNVRSYKAFRVRGPETLELLPAFQTAAWLLDSYSPSKHGGTGETFNWALAADAVKLGKPIILAGGLKPSNVGEAVRQVRPYAVDVSSGVESAPGKKDRALMRAFTQAVLEAR